MTRHDLTESLIGAILTLTSITLNWVDIQIVDFISNLNPVVIDDWVKVFLHLIQFLSGLAGLAIFLRQLFKSNKGNDNQG